MLAGRQHMLKVPPHELPGSEPGYAGLRGLGVHILESHARIIGREDPLVADGGAEHIAREIADDRLARAGVLAVHAPRPAPDRVGELRVQVRGRRAERVIKAAPEGRPERLDRQEPVRLPTRHPALRIRTETATGNDEVDMGMMLKLSPSGVQNADHSEHCAEQPWAIGH